MSTQSELERAVATINAAVEIIDERVMTLSEIVMVSRWRQFYAAAQEAFHAGNVESTAPEVPVEQWIQEHREAVS